ncbi:MAG: phosphoglycerate kinase [Phycisphaerales bacterium]
MPKMTIDQVDVAGKRILMRVDFNVPIEDGRITDDRRITAAIPSIKSVLDRGGRLVLMSHLGRPEGKGFEPEYSLEPCATRLTELLGNSVRGAVRFPSHDCTDGATLAAANMLADREAMMLENLRFHKGEKTGDPAFAAAIAQLGDVYCNNAFGTCHRADASMVAVPEAMHARPRVVGSLVEKEIRYLSDTLHDPAEPFVVILGGAKVSDKLPAIEFLIKRANTILIGGAMAYTFLKAQGVHVGDSRVEADRLDDARRTLEQAAKSGCNIMLPVDHVAASEFAATGGEVRTCPASIPDGFMGLDIGPATRVAYAAEVKKARTIVWNGPMGVFEWDLFSVGTQLLAEAIVEATQRGAVSIVGGGDSAAAAEQFGVADKLSHVSTGGGASLEMLAGKKFKAVELLDEAPGA